MSSLSLVGIGIVIFIGLVYFFVKKKENAEKLNLKAKNAGLRSFVNPITQNNKIMHQVCLGPEYDETDAKNLLKEIKNKMKLDGIVKKYP